MYGAGIARVRRRSTILARDRLERALERIRDPAGEGGRTCLTVYADSARAAADAADRRARDGMAIGPLDGVIVSIKDLFDVAKEPTRAGSVVLADSAPATSDAIVVQRLREAGAVIVAKTNMSEFAFTGVGANPHFGTPGNPWDRSRIPGGSSSGAAVAVAEGMCEISIGSDTGGSTRIPAALCGLTGYKPTKVRVPTKGAFRLSTTLDSVGPIASTVAACAMADAILAGDPPGLLERVSLDGLRFAIARGMPLSELDEEVADAFDSAIERLGRAGARLFEIDLSILNDMDRVNSKGTIATIEAYHLHRERLASRSAEIDPRVRERIEMGSAASAADYAGMLDERGALAGVMDSRFDEFELLVMPTTPIVAPTMEEISNPQGFRRANRLLLRNSAIANFFDLCAISLPISAGAALPTGFMLFGRRGGDRRLLAIAAAVERLFQS